MKPKEYRLPVWFMVYTANYSNHCILTTQWRWPLCTRPIPVQLATLLAHKTTNAMYTTDTSVTSIDLTCD